MKNFILVKVLLVSLAAYLIGYNSVKPIQCYSQAIKSDGSGLISTCACETRMDDSEYKVVLCITKEK